MSTVSQLTFCPLYIYIAFLNYISNHIIHLFPTISLLFLTLLLLIYFVLYCYTFSNISPSHLPFQFSTTTLMSLFFYPFLLLLFWFFLPPSYYYKFVILSPILHIFSHTKKLLLSLSLSFTHFCAWIFYFLYLYFRLMNLCVL